MTNLASIDKKVLGRVNFFLEKQIDFNSLLDIGCGDGLFVRAVESVFPNKKIVAIDNGMLDFKFKFSQLIEYKKSNSQCNIKVISGDFSTYKFNEKFKLVA